MPFAIDQEKFNGEIRIIPMHYTAIHHRYLPCIEYSYASESNLHSRNAPRTESMVLPLRI